MSASAQAANEVLAAALSYAHRGWCVIPLRGKDPSFMGSGWPQLATRDEDQIREWWTRNPHSNVGILTGARSSIFVLDIDPKNGGEESYEELVSKHGALPETLQAMTGGGGRHYYYQYPDGGIPSRGGLLPGIDVKSDGGQVVAPPSVHPQTRRQYEWDGLDGFDSLVNPAPEWLVDAIRQTSQAGKVFQMPTEILEGERDDRLYRLACSLRSRDRLSAEGIYAAIAAENQLRCKPPLPDRQVRKIANSAAKHKPGPSSVGTVREMPTAYAPPASVTDDARDLLRPLFNDHGNAQRLIACSGSDLRYCFDFRKWLVWDGRRWAIDTTDQARKLAKSAMLEFLRQAIAAGNTDAEKFAKASLDSKRLTNALREAECELPVTTDQLDSHPHILNFRNGPVDLKSGKLLRHDRALLITKLVHFDYNPSARCPVFMEFTWRIMGGGPDASEADIERAGRMVDYLQRACGYSLTGSTIEKVVFFAYGESGNNGKTTQLSLFRNLLIEYSTLLQVDTLMVRQESNNSQADLADLRGARFVMTSETEQGQRLAEGRLKRITQGMGTIKAIRKYENPVTFPETHKLWIDCNHKPVVRGTDNAIWNRLHLVPFEVTIPKEDIDHDLPAKLLAEAEGILAWAVAGAIRWYAGERLVRPNEMQKAADAYRGEMDQVGRFVDENCVVLPTARVKARELYGAYKKWAEDTNEPVMMETAFGRKITDRPGVVKVRKEIGVMYEGIGCRA